MEYHTKAHRILTGYNLQEEDLETNLSDLLCDLMHWCAKYEVNAQQALTRAMGHYAIEKLAVVTTEPSEQDVYIDAVRLISAN